MLIDSYAHRSLHIPINAATFFTEKGKARPRGKKANQTPCPYINRTHGELPAPNQKEPKRGGTQSDTMSPSPTSQKASKTLFTLRIDCHIRTFT